MDLHRLGRRQKSTNRPRLFIRFRVIPMRRSRTPASMGVTIGIGVSVGTDVSVCIGVSVGTGVSVGVDVFVSIGAVVGTDASVGIGASVRTDGAVSVGASVKFRVFVGKGAGRTSTPFCIRIRSSIPKAVPSLTTRSTEARCNECDAVLDE